MTMASSPAKDVFTSFTPPSKDTSDIEAELSPAAEGVEFDPFHIGESPRQGKATGITHHKKQAQESKTTSSSTSVASRGSTALPPRLDVRFKVHEEVSATTITDSESEGSSDVVIEGTVLAQVTSSDALKNSPFILVGASRSNAKVNFLPNETFAKSYTTKGQTSQVNVIKIPKSTVGFVSVGKFKVSERVGHMPLLLERKVKRSKTKIQISIQVRSKMTNPDDLTEFSIALAMSDKVAGDSVELVAGKGEWDRMSRTIVWKLQRLLKGESFMVSARARLTDDWADVPDSDLKFPVLLRCKSADQISSTEFQAIEASGFPATVSSSTVGHTYRIVNRLS